MNKIKLANIISFGITIIVGVVVFGISTQAAGYVPLEPSVAGEDFGGDYGGYFQRIYQLGIAIAGVLAVLFLVIGGFEYMLSESLFAKGAGKDKMQAALGGLILALASWMILNTINPYLVKFDLSLPEAEVQQSSDTRSTAVSGGLTEEEKAAAIKRADCIDNANTTYNTDVLMCGKITGNTKEQRVKRSACYKKADADLQENKSKCN
ncbi:pilin [Patescibacteria group bacterium]